MKLFIHGVPDTGFMWMPLIQALRLEDDAWLAPTLPGFGGTSAPRFSATKEAYLDWVIGKIEVVSNAHGAVDLVGHDWGAMLVAMAAQKRPKLVRTWTVINFVPEPTYEWHTIARVWQTPILGELFMVAGRRKKFRQRLMKVGMPEMLADHEAPLIDRQMKRAILELYRSAKNPGTWATDFSGIADRGLALWGADDLFISVEYARRFCERWSIPLAVELGIGHWGIFERPEAFARHLEAHWHR